MTPIGLQVPDEEYESLRRVAVRKGMPVGEVIHEAVVEYLHRHRPGGSSIFDIAPHASGAQLREWSRSELQDEMLDR